MSEKKDELKKQLIAETHYILSKIGLADEKPKKQK